MLHFIILSDSLAISLSVPMWTGGKVLFNLKAKWHSWTLFKCVNGSSESKMEIKSNNNLNILEPSQAIIRQDESFSRREETRVQNKSEILATHYIELLSIFTKYKIYITRSVDREGTRH